MRSRSPQMCVKHDRGQTGFDFTLESILQWKKITNNKNLKERVALTNKKKEYVKFCPLSAN